MRQNDDSEDVQQTGEVEDEDEVDYDSEDVQQMPAFSVCASPLPPLIRTGHHTP